jgi:hypothetical protein
MGSLSVRTGVAQGTDPAEVARALAAQVRQPGAVLTLAFASPALDANAFVVALGDELDEPVYGCTTAGEIGPGGFHRGGAVAISLAGAVRFSAGVVRDLGSSGPGTAAQAIRGAAEALGIALQDIARRDVVALLLVDGMSGAEEAVVATLAAAAPNLEIVGGSAGDDMKMQRTFVFVDGEAIPRGAVVLLLELGVPFTVLKTEHHMPTAAKLVVTDVDATGRKVRELNGRPARAEYARLAGLAPDESRLAAFSKTPFAVIVGGVPYIRSVKGIEGDMLHFACSLEEGVVLTLTRAGDLLATTIRAIEQASQRVGGASGVIAFNCAGRYLEAENDGLTERLGAIYGAYPLVGFNTYGEQHCALHMNNTLTGLVLGRTGAR